MTPGTLLVGKHLLQSTGFPVELKHLSGEHVIKSLLILTLAISRGLIVNLKIISVGMIQLNILSGPKAAFSVLVAGFRLLSLVGGAGCGTVISP